MCGVWYVACGVWCVASGVRVRVRAYARARVCVLFVYAGWVFVAAMQLMWAYKCNIE